MYSLHLRCAAEDVEQLIVELWLDGTLAVSESVAGDHVDLLAGFVDAHQAEALLQQFARYEPAWTLDTRDWVALSQAAWETRTIGEKLFLAPVWSTEGTPPGRTRIVHNPGMASGTGEHPCTRLALAALEDCVVNTTRMLDLGTGSGILAVAASKLGAGHTVAVDVDEGALTVAREHAELNGVSIGLATGSADCIRPEWATLAVANISATVLLDILPDLLRAAAPESVLILTGFCKDEGATFQQMLPDATTSEDEGWMCLKIRLHGTPGSFPDRSY